MQQPGIAIRLAPDEITLLIEALDSHEYWQLSESNERSDGHSTVENGTKSTQCEH